jgi:hypothetical protein
MAFRCVRNGGIAPCILNLGREMCDKLHTSVALPPNKEPGWVYPRDGLDVAAKTSFRESNHGHSPRSLVIILTETVRKKKAYKKKR